MEVTGKVVRVELEGGFWGIESDEGMQYKPVTALPAAAQREGARVRATLTPSPAVGIAMWGQAVELRGLEVLG